MPGDADRIRADMQVLSEHTGRYAGTEGEREMLNAVRERLPEHAQARVEGFVSHVRPATAMTAYAIALVIAGLVGTVWPLVGAVLAALVGFAVYGEASGRFALGRFWMMKAASYNLVARASPDEPLGTVVLVSSLDVPRWQLHSRSWLWWCRPMQATFAVTLFVAISSLVRGISADLAWRGLWIHLILVGIAALLLGLAALAHRRTSTGADDASGPAVLLELIRRFGERPVPSVDVWTAFTGCGHAYQGGMRHFLDLHGGSLRDPVLVVALEDVGRMPLQAVRSEGSLVFHTHRPTGLGLVERLSWAGLRVPTVHRFQPTNAREALLSNYRALALIGGEGKASPEAAGRAADVVEMLVRWYAEDVARVIRNRPALEELARLWRGEGPATEPPPAESPVAEEAS